MKNQTAVPAQPAPVDCSPISATDPFTRYLGPLLFLTLIFFANFWSRIVFSPLMPTIQDDLAISHAQAGSLFLMIACGYCVSLICSGFVAARLYHRKTIVLSTSALGLALLAISWSDTLFTLRLGLFSLGMGAGLYLPSGVASLAAMVPLSHRGKAIAVHETAPNLAFLAAPFLARILLQWLTWRQILLFAGGIIILLGLAFGRHARGEDFPGQAPKFKSLGQLARTPAFWIMTGLFCLGVSGTLGVFTMLPLYLVNSHGFDQNVANNIVSASRILAMFSALMGGWLSDRFGPKRTIMAVLALNGIVTVLIGVTTSHWLVGAIFLQALFAVCYFPAGFAALVTIGPPEARNLTVSATATFAFLFGGGLVPIFIGYLGNLEIFSWGFIVLGTTILVGAFSAGRLRLEKS